MIKGSSSVLGTESVLFALPKPRILELYLDLDTFCLSKSLQPAFEADRATASDNVVTSLTKSKRKDVGSQELGVNTSSPINLLVLRLHGFNLRNTSALLAKAIDPEKLDELSFQHCENELYFLRDLFNGSGGCAQLRRLEIFSTGQPPGYPQGNDGQRIIDTFLKSFNTLQSLIIHAPGMHFLKPDLSAVANHKESLRTLYLVFEPDSFATSYYHWPQLSRHLVPCYRLEQLALAFPNVRLSFFESNNEEWQEYLVSVNTVEDGGLD